MKSRITIEVDFEEGNQPVIIANLQNSDDVRDKLLKSFVEKFGHQRAWCQVHYMGLTGAGESRAWKIIAIEPKDHSEQGKLMKLLGDSEFPEPVYPVPPKQVAMVDGVPRRNRMDFLEPIEIEARDLMNKIETMGADVLLTDALNLVAKANDLIADYIEKNPDKYQPL